MKTLGIDLETYSSIDLGKAGVYAYTSAPDFEVLLLAYAFDDEPVNIIDLASGEQLPAAILKALTDDSVLKVAFNANFERTCLAAYLHQPLSPAAWSCTAVQAAMLGLPLHLEGVARVLKLETQKMSEGKALIRYFSVPCKPTKTNGGRTRNLPGHAPEKWTKFKEYCIRDVEVECAIRDKLKSYPISEKEQSLYILDQEINDRGILMDTVLVNNAIRCDEQHQTVIVAEAKNLTGLENPNSVAQLKDWLQNNGVEMETLAKKAVSQMAASTEGEVQQLLQLRQEMAKTSIRKYEAIQRALCPDGRVRGLLQFYGANRTGRWAGRLINVQNLPQNHLPDLDLARSLVKEGCFAELELLYESVPNVLSELIRTAFVPKPGHRFIIADFAAIEARIIAWMAGEDWVLDTFKGHGRIYEMTASRMFGVPVELIVKGNPEYVMRTKGKVATLACIAEGQLVLTDQGLVPIEKVTLAHQVWDGEAFVPHDGVIYQGKREVISYAGLTATRDHLVWIKGQAEPVQFEYAAASGAHLVRYGDKPQMKRVEYPGKARVYDILNAGKHNRFTVSGCLVHNCGYQGGANALIAMGALDMGLKEEELPGLVKAWRQANSKIVQYWYAIENAAKKPVRDKVPTAVGNVKFQVESGILFITLPSGRRLAYIRPRLQMDPRFNRESLIYEGLEQQSRQWQRQTTYAGKLVENIVQATARDCLAEAMLRIAHAGYLIVMHIHDEIVIEAPEGFGSLDEVLKIMREPLSWAEGLPLQADGFECDYYKKE